MTAAIGKVLITGGIRSGKSRTAEDLLAEQEKVTYLAPGPKADPVVDAEWAERIAHHQAQRPAHWRTIETSDVAEILPGLGEPVLLDCLGTWLAAQLDQTGAWDSLTGWESAISARIDALAAAWRAYPQQAVAVTNEVGWGLVPDNRSGRIFTDWLGRTNQAVGAASDEVWLVVAGRRLKLT